MEKHWTDSLDLLIDSCLPEVENSSRDHVPSPNGIQNQPFNSNSSGRRRSNAMKGFDLAPATPTTVRTFSAPDSAIVPAHLQSKVFPLSTAVSPMLGPVSSESSTTHILNRHAFDLPPICSPNMEAVRTNEERASWSEAAAHSFASSSMFDAAMEFTPLISTAAPSPTAPEDRMQRYLHMLDHSSSCFNRRCSLHECFKMKAFVSHVNKCSKQTSGCRLCQRFYTLSKMHASQCERDIGHCPVLFCSHFKLEMVNARDGTSKDF